MQDAAISRILKRMWNCRGKHTTSIDKVKMEQIIRDELLPVTTMRDATPEEQKSVSDYIKSISTPTGVKFSDAISRDAVIMECIKYADHEHNVRLKKEVSERRKHDAQVIIYVCDYFKSFIEKLPSVTQKSGKWILTIEDWNKWTCSNCGYVKRTDIHVNIGWNYCPNCGSKMVEPQESEEQTG